MMGLFYYTYSNKSYLSSTTKVDFLKFEIKRLMKEKVMGDQFLISGC